jgi:hypothetical protein
MEEAMDNIIASLAQVEVEEVYNEEDYPCMNNDGCCEECGLCYPIEEE